MRSWRKGLILLPPTVETEALIAAGWHRPRLRIATFAAAPATVRFDGRVDLVVDDGVFLVAGRRK